MKSALLATFLVAFVLGMVYADLTAQGKRTYCRAYLEDGRRLRANEVTPQGETGCRYETTHQPMRIGKRRVGTN